MKEQKEKKEEIVENSFGLRLTLNEDLNKYRGPEFEPPKLEKVRKKFSKGYTIHR